MAEVLVKMMRKALFLPLLFIMCVLVWSQGSYWYWRMHPERAFDALTGHSLPAGVQATAYTSEVTDNFFHRTHYWILSGQPEPLQEIVTGYHFQPSEDAAWNKPVANRLFNSTMKSSDLAAGYEREENGRNQWFWLSSDKSVGLYAY